MKEETKDTANTWTPTEAEMDGMHDNAWLDFHADAQEAKQTINRRYARMVDHFGSYKKMPEEMKDMFKDDYAAHKATWGEKGTEAQKRFGVKAEDPAKERPETIQPEPETKSLANEKEQFLKRVQETREKSQTRGMEVEV